MPVRELTLLELNRSLLARQHMIEPSEDLRSVIHDHVAIQAQEHLPPYLGLQQRVKNFQPNQLDELLRNRELIRATTFRSTIHLSLQEDHRMIQAETIAAMKHRLHGYLADKVEPELWLPTAIAAISGHTMSRPQMEALISEALPGYEAGTFNGQPLLSVLGLVRVPRKPAGVHGGTQDLWTRGDEWTGKPYAAPGNLKQLVRRYLAGYGPASAADMSTWTGITKLKPLFELMRDELVTYRGPDGEELFDVPSATITDGNTPMPLQLVAAYDSVLIAHRERKRIIDNPMRQHVMDKQGKGSTGILVDGRIHGQLKIKNDKAHVKLISKIPKAQEAILEEKIVAMNQTLNRKKVTVDFSLLP